MKRVLIGMSGGVDSSVAAYLLQKEGYEVVGLTMSLFNSNKEEGCTSSKVVEDAAKVCGITPEQYEAYETGTMDIPVGVLHSMAREYDFELTTLISGNEPHMKSYFLTKKDKGLSVDRRSDYKYQSLAFGFSNRKADPFIVSITPEETKEIHFNSHPGHEFNYMIEGSMKIVVDGKEMILEEGDSLYFDATKQHGMQALNNKPAKFLAIII